MDLHATVADRLAAADQRYTANRRAVVEVIEESERPLTIPEILEHRSGLAQSSLYRNLAVLEETGVVHRVHSSDDFARYELAEDLAGHHHHLICSSCGTVADFTVSADVEAVLAAAFEGVAGATGFRAEHHRLDLVGRCADCA
ncbi:MAG: transcriptional repressor [Acidimicrobiales bacterium]|nr:transcriptional repressor [Acidimicrobiales bacterium]